MIYGTGIDIIEVERIRKNIEAGKGFRERIFTAGEIEYCETKRNKAQNYAARFAAKEAFFKAIGTGWRHGMAHAEIEVVHDDMGKPGIRLHGKTRDFIGDSKNTIIQVSLSHLKEYTVAVVIIEKE